MPRREALLRQWLSECCGLEGCGFAPASADASFRRYFRIDLGDAGTRIVMDAPPDKEDCRPFVDVTRRLEEVGAHVPHIFAQDMDQGFLLLEDLGERLYLGELDADNVDRLYRDAIDTLLAIQSGDPRGLPHYDREMLEREMRLFPEWLLGAHLGIRLGPADRRMLDDTFERLVANALGQPQVLVHRDYHSRNLLLCPERSPGVIDYQDAVLGPLTYDPVSLLRDCYVAWPPARVDGWLDTYAQRAVAAGLLDASDLEQVPLWFDLMGAQRHLKAAGIFARLNHRDAKPGYLQDIPRTLGYIVSVSDRRPELAPLAGFIGDRVLPLLEAA
jgi:aminoglycoside/choline kinase family phosphotransferase